MSGKQYAISDSISGNEIRALRRSLSMTQQEAAAFFNVSKQTIERWERGNADVTGPIVTLVKILIDQPVLSEYYELPKKEYPMRLFYMFRREICTLIDVDESRQRVKVRNYTDRLQFRAFGINEKPRYSEYLEFLESRCFPRTRDKMKLVLRDLGIPFYDPLLIIEKTEGRMAEDEFWIRVER